MNKLKFSVSYINDEPQPTTIEVTHNIEPILLKGLKECTTLELDILKADKETFTDKTGNLTTRYTMDLTVEKVQELKEYVKAIYMHLFTQDKRNLN